MKKTVVLFALSLIMLSSCSIEKRVYRSGYHIEGFAEKQPNINPVNNKQTREIIQKEEVNQEVNFQPGIVDEIQPEASVELALATNNTEEVSPVVSPLIKNVHNQHLGQKTSKNSVVVQTKHQQKPKHEKSAPASDNKMIIAVLLWFFLGIFGIHRFYMGYTLIGIIYLCTGALFGIGWIVDGILFLTGNLKPRK